MSGISWSFTVVKAQMKVCASGITSPTLSYSLENALSSGSSTTLDPLTFMSIDPSNGIISISNQSVPSNFNYKVTAKASGISNSIVES